jgi:beta-lactamase regulating signal transducer with metallopeptidase domain/uncharacterized coiled-coil DUF342 family protein
MRLDPETFGRLLDVALRSTVLLGAAWLVAAALRRALPGLRQALWSWVLVGAVALPVMTPLLPAWRVLPSAWDGGRHEVPAPAQPVVSDGATGVESLVPRPAAPPIETSRHDWRGWAVRLWAAGSIVVAAWFTAGLGVLRRVTRAGRPARRRLRRAAAAAATCLGVGRPVRLLVSERIASPATWGLLRPIVALPASADHWGPERCRLVIAHEMVHVARWDWALRLVAQLGCVLYWFNPLAWIAARRLRREQELACDRAVLDLGARPSSYARHLLDLARAATRRRAQPALALDMAGGGRMEGRLMSILSQPPAPKLRRAALLPALSVIVALPMLAAVQPKPPSPPAPTSAPPEAASPAATSPAPAAEAEPAAVPSAPRASAVPAPAVTPTASAEPTASEAPVPPVATLHPSTPRQRALEDEIARRAGEIEALMAPLQEEIGRRMEEQMGPILDEMQRVELEMRPFQEEMSRIGREMSEALEGELPESGLSEELARQSEMLAREISERARLTEELMSSEAIDTERIRENARRLHEEIAPLRREMESLHRRMAEQRVSADSLRARLEPYRERMEKARASFEPQRERLEALQRELEPLRDNLERLREQHLEQVHERMQALREELRALELERRGIAPN